MRFGRWVFRVAGFYGVAAVAPMLFMESQIAPGAVYPVFFYGWVSVALAWQILFLVVSTDPTRYRPMMLVCVLEKAGAVVAIPWLHYAGRVGGTWLGAAATDAVFAVLFVVAYRAARALPGGPESRLTTG